MEKTMEKWMEFQKETMSNFLELATKNTPDTFKNAFNPFEVFNQFKPLENAKNSKKIIENNLKYHKAFIAYHQALSDMMEAINDNKTLMSTEK